MDRQAVGRKSKRKGESGERELAKLLKEAGYDCRRGRQYDGRGAADVIGLPGIHIECKRAEKLNLFEAIMQAIRDAKNGELPAVFHRKNRTPWLVIMPFDAWLILYRLSKLGERDGK